MTKWQRFGDDTWVNVDHVEVVGVEELDDGGWQLTATFTSGRAHPLGRHDDRHLLIDCTDVLLRGEVGDHLRALAAGPGDTPTAQAADPRSAGQRRRWWFARPRQQAPISAMDPNPDSVRPQPAG